MKRKEFKRIVSNLVTARINDSWKGGGNPDDIPGIQQDLRNARKQYKAALDELFSEQQPKAKSKKLEALSLDQWMIEEFLREDPQYSTTDELEMRAKARKAIDGLPNFELLRYIGMWYESQRAG